MKKCLNCKKLHNNLKFCSNKCCLNYCKKNKIGAFYNPELRKKSCSKGGVNAQATLKRLQLSAFYDPKIKKENARKAAITNKKNKTSCYFDPKILAENTKKGLETQRKNKIGFWNPNTTKKAKESQRRNKTGFFDSKVQCMLNKRALKVLRKNKLGMFSPEFHKKYQGFRDYPEILKKVIETNRKNNTAFFDPKVQSMGGQIGSSILRRNIKNILWNKIYFSSYQEREFGINIHHQIEKLIEGENFQVKVGNLTYDFFIKKFNCFIEYHPYNTLYDNVKSYKNWKIKRRQNLNQNGYKDSNLIIIK